MSSNQLQAQRTIDQELRKQSDREVKAFKKLGRAVFACEADAQQALAAFAQSLQAMFLYESTVRPQPHYGQRGRPGHGTQPDRVDYHVLLGFAVACAVAAVSFYLIELPVLRLKERFRGRLHA